MEPASARSAVGADRAKCDAAEEVLGSEKIVSMLTTLHSVCGVARAAP
mgnify:CR=1 FL=1